MRLLLLFSFNAVLLSACQQAPAPVRLVNSSVEYIIPYHVVQPGETLVTIAEKYGAATERLAKYNYIGMPYFIYPGQLLRLEKVEKSQVISGPQIKQLAQQGIRPSNLVMDKVETSTAKNVALPQNTSKKTNKPLATTNGTTASTWIWPVKGKVLKTFKAGNSLVLSNGIDITNKEGTLIHATDAGEVVYSGDALKGYGNLIIIKHAKNFLSAYAHNQQNLVKEGEKVKQGQVVAKMGKTGTDQVKLHFELRKAGKPLDPIQLLPKQ